MKILKPLFPLIFAFCMFTGIVLAEEITDTLEQGQIKVYYLDNIGYYTEVIMIHNADPPTVVFKVNGEMTHQLGEGDEFRFRNQALIIIHNITLDEAGESGVHTVTFTLSGSSAHDFLKISQLKLTINTLAVEWIDNKGETVEVHQADGLDFEIHVANWFDDDLYTIHNIEAFFSCTDAGKINPNNILVPVGDIPPSSDKEDNHAQTRVQHHAVPDVIVCDIITHGVDDLGITRQDIFSFNLDIREGSGMHPEICDDNIDNDQDALTDCEDFLDCGGFCIAELRRTVQHQQQQIETLQSKVKEQEKHLADFSSHMKDVQKKLRELWCAVFGCQK